MKELFDYIWNMPMSTLGEQVVVGVYAAIIYMVIIGGFMAWKFWRSK